MSAWVFLTGLDWGLPSRAADPYLFGQRTPWSGKEILSLAGERGGADELGADVARHPLGDRQKELGLNETDAQRAMIVRRFRLYSCQPDEMITMMSLAQMRVREGDFDPRLYQYGGLWIYGVGGLLKGADLLGWVRLKSDVAWYLDHPEQFGRFYVVARLYAALWGIVGAGAVFYLAWRMGGLWAAALAGVCYAWMPVVVNMAHEAKPHLPGVVLMLAAVIAAWKYAEGGGKRWWIGAGVMCGLSAGMVLSAAAAFAVLPVMVTLRGEGWRRGVWILLGAAGAGCAVYFATNPYVAIHLLGDRRVLTSNLGNSAAMYEAGQWGRGITNAIKLIGEGTGWVLPVAGIAGAAGMIAARKKFCDGGGKAAWLLGVLAVVAAVPFVAMAAGKPAEYGRFALFVDVAVAIAAAVTWMTWVRDRHWRIVAAGGMTICTAVAGMAYLATFVGDGAGMTSRLAAAERLREVKRLGAESVGVYAEPAPYCMPPVDLFQWRMVLLPKTQETGLADVVVRPVEGVSWRDADLGWAAKRFEVVGRR